MIDELQECVSNDFLMKFMDGTDEMVILYDSEGANGDDDFDDNETDESVAGSVNVQNMQHNEVVIVDDAAKAADDDEKDENDNTVDDDGQIADFDVNESVEVSKEKPSVAEDAGAPTEDTDLGGDGIELQAMQPGAEIVYEDEEANGDDEDGNVTGSVNVQNVPINQVDIVYDDKKENIDVAVLDDVGKGGDDDEKDENLDILYNDGNEDNDGQIEELNVNESTKESKENPSGGSPPSTDLTDNVQGDEEK